MRINRGFVFGAFLLMLCAGGRMRGEEVPADAQKLVAGFEQEAADIQERADKLIQVRREKLIASLQVLRERYAKDGLLAQAEAVRVQIEKQTVGATDAKPDPGTLVALRGQNGQSFYFEVTGNKNGGSVYGTDLYTDDSSLAAATVHAGALTDGQKGVVKVTVLPGADAYQGSDRNGVSSFNWGAWLGSYRIQTAARRPGGKPVRGAVEVKPGPGNLLALRGQNGQSFYFEVTGDKGAGTVWGTDLYTDDSTLAAAAVHAGALADGQKGVVKVTVVPGADAYQGSDRNGVASIDYGGWGGSYRIEAIKK
jgi:LCCL domain